MNMEHRVPRDAVKDLMPVGEVWAIAVKVLKLWTKVLDDGQSYMKIIVCDKKGDRIGATILPRDAESFQDHLVEGEWRVIFGFRVVRAISVPRLSEHKCEIVFKRTTAIRYVAPISVSMFINSPEFEDVFNNKANTYVLTDAMGYIFGVGYLRREEPARENEEPYTLAFGLVDDNDDVLSCVANESIARRLYEEGISQGKRGMVCLLRFWILEKEIGAQYTKVICSSVRGLSEFFFNPLIEEAYEFRSNFLSQTDHGSVIDP